MPNINPTKQVSEHELNVRLENKLKRYQSQAFGRLKVLFFSHRDHKGRYVFNCECLCGAKLKVLASSLTSGNTTSCGCFHKENLIKRSTKHGLSRRPERDIHKQIVNRTTNPNCEAAENYILRGITCCERWLGPQGFENFYADMGPRPSQLHTIEREDNDGPYSPENCIWATRDIQARNTRRNRKLTFEGKTLCISEWARIKGWRPCVILKRLHRGWSVEQALTTPLNHGQIIK